MVYPPALLLVLVLLVGAVAGYLAAAGFGVAAQQTATEIAEYQSTALARYTDVKTESSIYF